MARLSEKLTDIAAGAIVKKKIETIDVDVNKIAFLINQHFIEGASEEELTAVRKYIRQEFKFFQIVKPITTKDGLYTLNIIKYNRLFKLRLHRITFMDDSAAEKRTVYLYRKFSYKEFLNTMNHYLEPEVYGKL